MLILSIDTSTKHFSLAVSENGTVLGSKSLKSKKVLSSTIIPAIEKVLKKAGVTLDKIDGFAVGLGPGSFTSLRVGVATVKGLANEQAHCRGPEPGCPGFKCKKKKCPGMYGLRC